MSSKHLCFSYNLAIIQRTTYERPYVVEYGYHSSDSHCMPPKYSLYAFDIYYDRKSHMYA
jgi:hypothetical protein